MKMKIHSSVALILQTAAVFALVGCSTTGTVVVRSEPAGANVYFVDSKAGLNSLIGTTPLTFKKSERAAGNDVIQLRVEKDGFEPKYSAVAAFSGQTTFVDLKLRSQSVAKGEIRDAFEAVRTLMLDANRLVLAKRFSEALGKIEKSLELDPKNAEVHAAKGSVLLLMKDLEGAQTAWNRALEFNPGLQAVRDSLLQLNLRNDLSRGPASTEEIR